MNAVRAWASGKLILAGEHAVVHGMPALAFAVDLGTEVSLTPQEGPTTVHAAFTDPRLLAAVHTGVGAHGWQVHIHSTLPIGRGMGSSASLAVALARAHAQTVGTPVDIYAHALRVESLFHDTPSGVDVAVATHGGVLRFRRATPPTLTPLPCPDWQVVVIDTGKVGVTSALVQGVTARRPGIDPLLERIGALVDQATQVLDVPEALGPLLTENHALLRGIGVSTDELDHLVQLALDHGALGAKLSGAGGGGVVIALAHETEPVLAAARAVGYDAWVCRPTEAP